MKKILLVTRPIAPPWDEASKNFAYYLAKNVTDLEFGLLTNGILPDLPPNVRRKAIYTSNDFSYFQKLRLIKNLRKIKKDFDILHYVFTPTKQNTFLIKHFVSCKNRSVRTIQTVATLREDLYSEKDIKNLMFGDLIITYSDYAKVKLNAMGLQNVKRVYPGIDLNIYKSTEKDPEFLKAFNLTNEDFIVLYEGEYVRLDFTDDLIDFIVAYADELRKRNIKIIFPGRLKGKEDIEKKKEIKKFLEDKNLADIVRLDKTESLDATRADYMRKKFNISDVLIFPVKNMRGKFDIPLAVVEAMACEKPVILSDLPILGELSNGQNSVIITRGDIEALKNAIFDLYDHPDKGKEMGQNARKFVEENFDITKIADIYKQIYEVL